MTIAATEMTRPASTVSPRHDLLVAVCGLWTVGGLVADGWAHLAKKPDSFFTPWHGLLYAGLLATSIAVAVAVWGQVAHGQGVPAVYRGAVWGLMLFSLGGLADLAWHERFGIELSTAALLSPPHLVLFTGASLFLTAPARSRWALGCHASIERIVVITSVTVTAVLVTFFLQFVAPYRSNPMTPSSLEQIEGVAPSMREVALASLHSRGVAAMLITTAILLVGVLVLRARFGLGRWSVLTLVVVQAISSSALRGFGSAYLLPGAVAAVGATLAASSLVRDRRRAVAFEVCLLPVLTWSAYVASTAVTGRLAWEPEIWAGSVILCSLLGFAIAAAASAGLVALPAARPVGDLGGADMPPPPSHEASTPRPLAGDPVTVG